MFEKAMVRRLMALALVTSAVTVQADVFNMPNQQTSLQFVTVGDPGNARHGYGRRLRLGSLCLKMGTYDVTVGQYCQFLNAVATTGDPYGLYNIGMATEFRPGISQAEVRATTATRLPVPTARASTVRSSMSLGVMRRGSATGCKTASHRGRRNGTTETGGLYLGRRQRPSRS